VTAELERWRPAKPVAQAAPADLASLIAVSPASLHLEDAEPAHTLRHAASGGGVDAGQLAELALLDPAATAGRQLQLA
jgi:hypothetical protein